MSESGRRILVLRPEGQSEVIARLLTEAGAEPVVVPAIEILPPEDISDIDAFIEDAGHFDWAVFTSVNGAGMVLQRMGQRGSLSASARVAAVGPATKEVLEAGGIRVTWVPERFTTEELARTLPKPGPPPGRHPRVALIRAQAADSRLEEIMRERGFEVRRIDAYQTVAIGAAEIRSALDSGVDAIAFTSASIVDSFVQAAGPDPRGAVVAVIGPATAEACRRAGLPVDVEAQEHTTGGLVSAMVEYLRKQPMNRR